MDIRMPDRVKKLPMLRDILKNGLVSFWVSVVCLGLPLSLMAELDPAQLSLSETFEGLYDVQLSCPGVAASDPVCKTLITYVDFGSFAVGRERLYAQFSKRGQNWPFYGFKLVPSKDGRTVSGNTGNGRLQVEMMLDRDPDSGVLSGWVRDARVAADVKVFASPMKLSIKRPFLKLYRRKIAGEPLAVDEVAGQYQGIAQERGSFVVKESALSPNILIGASFTHDKDSSVQTFSEITLDPIRGLLLMTEFDRGLPSFKWVLAFRREDIDDHPWLLGTGLSLRKPAAYDVNLEKR